MTEKRVGYLSILRAAGCVAIVILHTFYLGLSAYAATTAHQILSMVVRNILLWAVPCFVMVSGALLLDPEKEMTIAKIARTYLRRVLLALLIATFVFSLFDALVGEGFSVAQLFRDWLADLWTNGSWPHMWYLYLLIGLYLMLPLYRLVTATRDTRILLYAIGIFFVFLSVIPTIGYISGRASGLYLLSYTVYPFYFFMGYALHTGTISLPRTVAWTLVVAGTLILFLCTVFSVRTGNEALRSLSGSYASVPVAMQAIGLFSLLRNGRKMTKGSVARFLLRVDAMSFGIYLVHVLFIYLFYRVLKWNPYVAGGILLVPITVLVFILSYGLTAVLKKIPGADRII